MLVEFKINFDNAFTDLKWLYRVPNGPPGGPPISFFWISHFWHQSEISQGSGTGNELHLLVRKKKWVYQNIKFQFLALFYEIL